jgi:hypothetical protein
VTRREYVVEHVDVAAVVLNALLRPSPLLEFS